MNFSIWITPSLQRFNNGKEDNRLACKPFSNQGDSLSQIDIRYDRIGTYIIYFVIIVLYNQIKNTNEFFIYVIEILFLITYLRAS